MKSSLRKLRDFTLHKSGSRDKRSSDAQLRHGDGIEAVVPNMKVLKDMQEQYDGLLAAAQSISGSSYDFSRSIHEMASCMVEMFGKTGNGDIGSNLSMLAKVHYEISKLLDLYATHVSQTIIKPTENLLKELESVDAFRQQYEKKRYLYNQMRLQKPKGRHKKGDVLDQQLSTIKEQLDEQATQLDLSFQSLKHGQELSLMTQAARHHKAQVHLFAKGLNSLNAVESMIKQLSTEFHIDDTLSEGESGLQLYEDSYEEGVGFLEHNDEDVSSSSSQGSSQPMTAERKENKAMGMQKPWENISKSAPLHPSLYTRTNNALVAQELDVQGPSYALPSPTDGPAARFCNQASNNTSKADPSRVDVLPELPRIRTGTAVTSEGARGLTGLSNVEAYDPSYVRHALRREEVHPLKENRGLYRARRSPSHSHSTSFSEGLDPLSAVSHGQTGFLALTPTFSYKRATKENDMMLTGTHLVDPLYKSGPVGRSAPWGLSPSRVSPCTSPPVSHLSPPLISELHKLPAPPPPPPSPPPPPPPPPPKLESVLAHSVFLGKKPGHKSTMATSTLSSSAVSLVKKSRSMPSSVNFAQNLHHTKVVRTDDSPVVESP